MTDKEFESIAPQLRARMLSVALNFFGNRMDAEEAAQDGLVALWKYRDRMDPDIEHEALAVRIAKHCCIDLTRQHADCPHRGPCTSRLRDNHPADARSGPQEEMEDSEMRRAMERAVENLNPAERRLFELRQIEGKSLDEIAAQTKMAKTSVKSVVSAARRKIFEEMRREFDLPEKDLAKPKIQTHRNT